MHSRVGSQEPLILFCCCILLNADATQPLVGVYKLHSMYFNSHYSHSYYLCSTLPILVVSIVVSVIAVDENFEAPSSCTGCK